jgi:hypothetical protein
MEHFRKTAWKQAVFGYIWQKNNNIAIFCFGTDSRIARNMDEGRGKAAFSYNERKNRRIVRKYCTMREFLNYVLCINKRTLQKSLNGAKD